MWSYAKITCKPLNYHVTSIRITCLWITMWSPGYYSKIITVLRQTTFLVGILFMSIFFSEYTVWCKYFTKESGLSCTCNLLDMDWHVCCIRHEGKCVHYFNAISTLHDVYKIIILHNNYALVCSREDIFHNIICSYSYAVYNNILYYTKLNVPDLE